MRRALRGFATAVVTACLVLVALPAVAAEPVDDFIGVPFTTYGDMLVDSARGQVFVTGGYGTNQIAVVHLDGSGVTMIPNAPGATKMSMTQDGRYVYVTLRNGDGIAEVDTTTLSLRRLDTGANSCPTDVAAVAGYVWFTASGDDCNQSGAIRRLDPASGQVSPDVLAGSLHQAALRVEPGTTRLVYAETGISASRVGVYDVGDGTLDHLVAKSSLSKTLSDAVRLSNDGRHLMTPAYGAVEFYRTTDFAADGVTSFPGNWSRVFAADTDVTVATGSSSSHVKVMDRGTDSTVNEIYLGPKTSPASYVKDLELVGDQMFAATLGTTAGSTLRLYQVDRPAVAPPDLTLEAPGETQVGSPLTLSGRLTDHGTPIAGAVVTVRQAGVDQPLGSPTTDADGRYSLELVPQQQEMLDLSARYDGDGATKAVVTRASVSVVGRQVSLALSGPSSVWPDEQVTLNGTLFDDTQPLGGVTLQVERRCGGSSGWQLVGTAVTGDGGTFTRSDTPGTCSSYEYAVRYDGDGDRSPQSAYTTVAVNWVQPTFDLQAPSSAHVGDTLEVTGTLNTPDGPLSDAAVVIRVSTPSGWRDLGTVTTDATGWFATEDTPSVAGSHCYSVAYAGDSRRLATSRSRCVGVTRWVTSLDVAADATQVNLDDPVVLTGRLTSEAGPMSGVELAVSRADRFRGTVILPTVVTGADGSFVVRDTPPNGGDVAYAVAYAGTARFDAASAKQTVGVTRPPRSLELTTDRSAYSYGQTAQIAVDLVSSSDRSVQVYAQEAGRAQALVFFGVVPETGLTLQHLMTRNTTFSVTIPEDGRALAASATAETTTRSGLTTKALGSYGTSGRYWLYRPSADPRFAAKVLPKRVGGCVHFQLQRHYSAGWRTVSTTPCVSTSDLGTATWKLTGTQATRTPYRVRPSYGADGWNAASTGAWVYFKFV